MYIYLTFKTNKTNIMEALTRLKAVRDAMTVETKYFTVLDGTHRSAKIVIQAEGDEATYLIEVDADEFMDEYFNCSNSNVEEWIKEQQEWQHDNAFLRAQFFNNLDNLTIITE